MAEYKRAQAYRVSDASAHETGPEPSETEAEQTLELREEQLIAHKELRDLGEIEVRTEVEEFPGRLEVDAYREEVVVEHEAVGQMVSEREKPWEEEDGVLVIPIYEEQLVVTKRLVLKERMRVRRVGTTERQLFEDTLRRERMVVDDPNNTGLLREQYPTDEPEASPTHDKAEPGEPTAPEGGFFEHLVRKALE
ncbi:MAG: YsnF/AvaK domain-containing protein [Chloroflexota bacterium]